MGRTWGAGQQARALAALALLLLLGGAAVLAVPYRHSLSTVRAYEAAPRTRGVPAVVRKLENYSNGHGGTYWVKVTGPPSVAGKIVLDDSGPVLSKLRKGDRIGVVVWHGHRTDITFEGRRQQTNEAPTLYPNLFLCAGLGMPVGAVLALYIADRLRHGTYDFDQKLPLTGRLIFGAGAVTIWSGIANSGTHKSDPLSFLGLWVLSAAVALGCWRVRRWYENRRADPD